MNKMFPALDLENINLPSRPTSTASSFVMPPTIRLKNINHSSSLTMILPIKEGKGDNKENNCQKYTNKAPQVHDMSTVQHVIEFNFPCWKSV